MITSKSEAIRRQWLEAFFIGIATYWISCVLLLVPGMVRESLLAEDSLIVCVYMWVLVMLFCFMVVATLAWITFYFAYKKHGTKWLLFQLIYIPLAFAGFITRTNKLGMNIENIMLQIIIIVPVIALYWIRSYRLYQFNRVQRQERHKEQRQDLLNEE